MAISGQPAAGPVFIFDIGNVLIDFDLAGLQARIAAESDTPLAGVQGRWDGDDLIAVETGRIRGPEYFDGLRDSLSLPWSYEDWVQAWMDVYALNENGRGLLLDLKGRGHPVCLLSNLAEYNRDAIERKFPGFFEASTANFFSFEIGFHKPDPRAYGAACRRLAVPPAGCTFLDDSFENVRGAREFGMNGIHFSGDEFARVVREVEAVTPAR